MELREGGEKRGRERERERRQRGPRVCMCARQCHDVRARVPNAATQSAAGEKGACAVFDRAPPRAVSLLPSARWRGGRSARAWHARRRRRPSKRIMFLRAPADPWTARGEGEKGSEQPRPQYPACCVCACLRCARRKSYANDPTTGGAACGRRAQIFEPLHPVASLPLPEGVGRRQRRRRAHARA